MKVKTSNYFFFPRTEFPFVVFPSIICLIWHIHYHVQNLKEELGCSLPNLIPKLVLDVLNRHYYEWSKSKATNGLFITFNPRIKWQTFFKSYHNLFCLFFPLLQIHQPHHCPFSFYDCYGCWSVDSSVVMDPFLKLCVSDGMQGVSMQTTKGKERRHFI